MPKHLLLLTFICLILLLSCKEKKETSQDSSISKPLIAAVNYPLHYFTEKIGGDLVDVNFPVPPDVDPPYWNPDQTAISIYQEADLIMINGANYAKWLEKVSLSASRIVNTSKTFQNHYIEIQEGVTHSHGPGKDHSHRGYAFTTWLNFRYALLQAEAVKAAMVKRLPEAKDALEKNFLELKTDLVKIDNQMKQVADKLQGSVLYGSHPVYQYLAEGYHLKIIAEHWEPENMPTIDQWDAFKEKLQHYPGKIMLWENNPLPEVEKTLNDLGVAPVVFNPGANRQAGGSFIEIMRGNLDRLNKAVIKSNG